MASQPSSLLTDADRAALAARGITAAEAERQLRLLAAPAAYASLVRPCTVGDGIERIEDGRLPALLERAARATRAGRVSRFVPASGAATRMFRDLLAWRGRGGATSRAALDSAAAAGDAEAIAVQAFLRGLPRFAFRDALAHVVARAGHDPDGLAASGPVEPLLEALLGPAGLGYAERPKGLLAFHREADGPRTAFEEQLEEAAVGARDAEGRCRAHFTVSSEHRAGFDALLAGCAPRVGARHHASFEVTFSAQSPATDTLALDADGRPFRDERGALLFRPAGHGALIGNLAALGGDLVQVKNIDNVQPDGQRAATLHAWAVLCGLALETEEAVRDLLARLADTGDGGACVAAEGFAREALGLAPGLDAAPDRRAAWRALLDRPLRVCGMVPNTGEPGGGPFWVRGRDGVVRPQVVEGAEVDPASAAQLAVVRGATHFNPVLHGVRGARWERRGPRAGALRGPGRGDPRAQERGRARADRSRAPGPVERRDGGLADALRGAADRGVHAGQDRRGPAAPRASAGGGRVSDPRAHVLEALERWAAAVSAADLAATLALFAPGAGVTLIGSEAAEVHIGPAALEAFFRRLYDRRVRYRWEWTRREVEVRGEVAWLFADGDMVMTHIDGTVARGRYRITGVLVRHAGEWRWHQYHGSEPVG